MPTYPGQPYQPHQPSSLLGGAHLGVHSYAPHTNLAQAAQAGAQNPNPAAHPAPQQAGAATAQGVQQAAQGVGIQLPQPTTQPTPQAPTGVVVPPAGPSGTAYQQGKQAAPRFESQAPLSILELASKYANVGGVATGGALSSGGGGKLSSGLKSAPSALSTVATAPVTVGSVSTKIASLLKRASPTMSPPPPGTPAGTPPPPPPGSPPLVPPPGAIVPTPQPPGAPPPGAPPGAPPGMPPGAPMDPSQGMAPPPPPVQPNPQADVNPPRPRTSRDAARDAILLSMMEGHQNFPGPAAAQNTDSMVSDTKIGGDFESIFKLASQYAKSAGLLQSVGNLFRGGARAAQPLAQAGRTLMSLPVSPGRVVPQAAHIVEQSMAPSVMGQILPQARRAPALMSRPMVAPPGTAPTGFSQPTPGYVPSTPQPVSGMRPPTQSTPAQVLHPTPQPAWASAQQRAMSPADIERAMGVQSPAMSAGGQVGRAPAQATPVQVSHPLFDTHTNSVPNPRDPLGTLQVPQMREGSSLFSSSGKTGEDSDTPVSLSPEQMMFGNNHMRGWQWKALQREQDKAQSSWMPRLFKSDSTPLTELLASPGKQGLLKALLGGTVGAGLGAGVSALSGSPLGLSTGLGAGAGALLSGIHGYGARRRENDKITDALRRSPPGATVRDYNTIQEMDEKRGAQDNSRGLQRSAVGESKGLSYINDPDGYAQGQAAWASLGSKFRGGRTGDDAPNPFLGKHAGALSPLARGFFSFCAQASMDYQRIKHAVDNIDTAVFGAEVKKELAGALEKVAASPLDLARRGWQGLKGMFSAAAPTGSAAQLLRQVPHTPVSPSLGLPAVGGAPSRFQGVGAQALGQALPTLGGAAGGAFASDPDVNPWVGAIAGGAAFNPALRRVAGRNPGLQTLMHPAQHAILGGSLGLAGDQMLGNTDHSLQRLGSRVGLGTGLAHGAANAAASYGYGGGRLGAAGNVAGTLNRGVGGATNVLTGMMEPEINATTYPFRQIYSGGRPPFFPSGQPITAAPGMARRAGIWAGGVGGAVGAGAAGMSMIGNHMENRAEGAVARMAPHVADYAEHRTNQYLDRLGVRNQQTGRLDLGGGIMNSLDGIFSAIGLDPSRMSHGQKLMMLLGTLGGAGGLLTGNHGLATVGGLSALAGGFGLGGNGAGWGGAPLQHLLSGFGGGQAPAQAPPAGSAAPGVVQQAAAAHAQPATTAAGPNEYERAQQVRQQLTAPPDRARGLFGL